MPDEMLIVGRVGKPHGVHGHVYVDLITDRHERVEPGAQLWVGERRLVVAASRRAGDRWVVHFEGVDDRNAAARLTLSELQAEPVEDLDALWVHELIGALVVESDGTSRGRCVAVIDNPAADLLELDDGALVPVTFVVEAQPGLITIDPPPGLFELGER